MGLNDVYQPIRSNILTRDPLPNFKTAYAILSREESHRGIVTNDVSKVVQTSNFMAKANNNNNSVQSSTFMAKTNNNSGFKKGPRGPNTNFHCTKCGMMGHTIERCFEIIGYPPWYKRKPFNQFAPKFVANTNNSVSNKCVSNSESYSFPFSEEQIQKIMSLISNDKEPANEVNTAMAGGFYYFNTYFNENITKFFCSNLINKPLTHINNWIVDSGANQHMVCFEHNLIEKVDVSKFNITVGHPNGTKAKIQKVGKYQLNNSIVLNNVLLVPEYCVNLLSVNRLTKDSDIFVGFDKDRCYLQDLKGNKTLGIGDEINDQVFDNLVQFYNLLKNRFNVSIKIIRSNNGTEFCNSNVQSFCDSKGIFHQTSCSYTPQQNGIVERKHRHLLNVARSLMFQGGLPLTFWSECVLTAVYLINRLPTIVLAGKSPFECVFGYKPSLTLTLEFLVVCVMLLF
ncbi:uncharacterized protein [Rutidosis leptorrhynchoides]|uniref:uncharacterized protein n=1 Tax=Rutidosis leptorrhynchoides TaxID=125765 RepID=UPI003A993AFF